MEQAIFRDATLDDASFAGCALGYADFSYASAKGADFTGAGLFRTRFHGTKGAEGVLASHPEALGDDDALAAAERAAAERINRQAIVGEVR